MKEIYFAGGCFWGTEHFFKQVEGVKETETNYYPAEEYHQDYLDKNPDGYCHLPLELFEFAKKAKARK